MEDIIAVSLDWFHKTVLKYVSEIYFGPAYYALTIDKISFGACFGQSILVVSGWISI
jgi:hypothetical protein